MAHFPKTGIRLLLDILAVLAIANAAFIPHRAAAQSCELFSECMTNGQCQPDGSCVGTQRADGTSCDDQNPCTTNDQCQFGECFGDPVANGTPCTDELGDCTTNDQCRFGFCFGDYSCPDDNDPCTFDCDFLQGRCGHIAVDCNDDCSTSECDPATGDCVNFQPKPDGTSCDNFNECTSGDQCMSGECVGGGQPAPTSTPTLSGMPPTQTPTSTPRVPPTLGPCVGDCDGDGEVKINELIVGVNIALGKAEVSACSAFDTNSDGEVAVNELISAVNSTLNGCVGGTPGADTPTPGEPTSTPTGTAPTPTGQTPTATPTDRAPTATETVPAGSPSIGRRAAGTIEVAGTAMLSVSNVFALLLRQGANLGNALSSARGISLPPFSCPEGGQVVVECSQSIGGFPPTVTAPTYTFTASQCAMTGSAGTTVTLNGAITATGQQDGDVCFVNIPTTFDLAIPDFTVTAESTEVTVISTLTGITGSLSLTGSDPTCTYSGVHAQLTGTMTVETKNPGGETLSSTEATFNNTDISMVVDQYGSGCSVDIYTVTVNGTVTLTTAGNTFAATYTDYAMRNDRTGGDGNLATVSGSITSECFGTTVTVATSTPLVTGTGEGCPTGGEVTAAHDGTTDRIRYTATGGVEIDLGDNGSIDDTFDSCLNPALFICPA